MTTVETAKARDTARAHLLMTYICTGLFFMLVPGTFLGVMNLVQISGRESVSLVSSAWLQAHGHAQVFGWIGSFILGIGFYAVPKLRDGATSALRLAWASWAMWTSGVALRWMANVYLWHWRVLLPLSASLELIAFLIFFRAVAQHPPSAPGKPRMEPFVWVVASGATGLLVALLLNLSSAVALARTSVSPTLPHAFDQHLLVVLAWGFMTPFVWGFTAKWMPVLLGLRPTRVTLLLAAPIVSAIGILLTLLGWGAMATWLFVVATVLAILALRLFEPAEHAAKTRGVHSSFPFFVRMAYGWLLLAAILGVAAAAWDSSGGIWGASRHALTVGFVSVMVFSVGPRVLPAFAGLRPLWSPALMLLALVLLTIGCFLRVSSEILAYQGYATWAWSVLPVSAIIELAAVTTFAVNLGGSFLLDPATA